MCIDMCTGMCADMGLRHVYGMYTDMRMMLFFGCSDKAYIDSHVGMLMGT